MKPSVPLAAFAAAAALASTPCAAAGGGEMPSLVFDISVCFVAAGLLAVLFARLGIPEIAAFLLAGALVGPFATGIVSDPDNIDTIAGLGLILLLFVVGLEINLKKLMASGRTLIVTGTLQYPICVAVSFVLVKLLVFAGLGGGLFGTSSYVALYTGFVVAASSTLLVVKLFQQHLQLDTQSGRVSLGLLIFQDFWAIIVIAAQPNFSSPEPGPILHTLAGVVMLSAIAFALARFVVPIAFRWISKTPEIILVAAIAWCFSVVFIGHGLDAAVSAIVPLKHSIAVGSSMGALIAGASIASLPHSMEVTGKISSVRDFFVILFFVGLGMGIPRIEDAGVLVLALALALVTVVARYVVFFPLLYFTGLDRRNAFVTSSRLAQVSEFSLVVGFLGLQLGHISVEFNSAIIFAFIITALTTPLLFRNADRLHDRFAGILDAVGFRVPADGGEDAKENYKIAVLGFHRTASSLLHELERAFPGILKETIVVDFNVSIHDRIAALGPVVRYGDLSNESTLHHVGIDRASLIVCTVPDDLLKGTSNLRLVQLSRHLNPNALIVANALKFDEVRRLYDAGADYVFLPRVDSAVALTSAIEKALNGDLEALRAEARSRLEEDRREVLP